MKRMIFAVAVSTLATLTVFTQTPTPARPAGGGAAPAAAAPAGGTGAEGKLAYVVTGQFQVGIDELKVRLEALNVELEPKKKEIQALEEEVNNLKSKIQAQGSTVSVQVRNQWLEEAAEKEKTLKRRAEDYEALVQRRYGEAAQPVYEKISKFLEQYCTQKGIVMVLEAGAAQQAGVLLFAAQATNITDDFIQAYNKANPAVK